MFLEKHETHDRLGYTAARSFVVAVLSDKRQRVGQRRGLPANMVKKDMSHVKARERKG